VRMFVRSLSIRRSAAATRSRARSQSAMVYCRGFGRMRFLRGALHDIRRTLPKKIVLARNVFVLFVPFMLDARQLRDNLLGSEHSSHSEINRGSSCAKAG